MSDEEEQAWYGSVLRILDDHNHISVEESTFAICVPPKDETGFYVAIEAGANDFTVYHDFWHEEYENFDEALTYFLLGLTTAERVKIISSGDWAHRWEVETNVEGNWGSMGSVIGPFLFPFWLRPNIRYLQHDWIATEALHELIPSHFTTCRLSI